MASLWYLGVLCPGPRRHQREGFVVVGCSCLLSSRLPRYESRPREDVISILPPLGLLCPGGDQRGNGLRRPEIGDKRDHS